MLLGEEVLLSLLNRSIMNEPPQRPRLDPFAIRQDIFAWTEEACQRGKDYCSGFYFRLVIAYLGRFVCFGSFTDLGGCSGESYVVPY